MFDSSFIHRESYKDTYGTDPTKDTSHYLRKDRLKQIRIYHEKIGGGSVDDVTWNDLDMDAVFFRINRTASYIGEQVLYHRLHCAAEERDWVRFEDMLSLLDQDRETRQRIEKKFCIIGRKQTAYYMTVLLSCFCPYHKKQIALFRMLQIMLFTMLVGWMLFAANTCRVLFLLVAALNLSIYIHEKQKAENMLVCLEEVCSLLEFCEYLKKDKKLRRKTESLPEDYCSHVMYLFSGDYITITNGKGNLKFKGYYSSVYTINQSTFYCKPNNQSNAIVKAIAQNDTVKKYVVDLLGKLGGEIRCSEPLPFVGEKKSS